MSKSPKSALSRSKCACLSGTLVCVLGIALFLLNAQLLNFILSSVLVLKPNSYVAKNWLKTPIEIPTDFYFFNWTNPDDFYNASIKPKLKQVGPYRIRHNMEKVNVVWNDNDTVTYNRLLTWDIHQKDTIGNLNDTITSVNAIAMGTAHRANNWPYFGKKLASVFLSATAPEIPITKTVQEFLIEGYDDPIIDMSRYVPFIASNIPRFTKFGWLFILNGSIEFEGVYNTGTGVNGNFDVRNLNYQNETTYFDSSCAQVQGSDFELFSYERSKDYLDIYVSIICRYVRLDFEEEVTVKGILGYKYSVGKSTLDNGTLIAGNECFCAGDCLPSGLINASSCRYGTPTFVSLPHFYTADPIYLDAADILQPEKSKHEAYVILEPTTAVLLKAAARFQINIYVHPIKDIQTYEDFREIFFPLFWGEQSYIIGGYDEVLLKLHLCAPYILDAISIILAAVGLYLIIFVGCRSTLLCLFKKRCKEKYECKTAEPEQIPLYS